MLTRKALWIPALASLGLLIVLGVAGWSIDSSPLSSPVQSAQTTTPTQSVSIVPTPDVVDELAEAVIDGGGTVTHVTADTELKEHLVAVAVRFPLPPEPETAG